MAGSTGAFIEVLGSMVVGLICRNGGLSFGWNLTFLIQFRCVLHGTENGIEYIESQCCTIPFEYGFE